MKTKSLDTPTIDTDLEQLFLNDIFYVGDDLPQTSDGKDKFVLLGTPYDFMLAIMDWHKDKARSYVPEKRNGAVDPQTGAPVGMQGCVDHGFDQAIDQTLKSIEEDKI